MAWFSVHPSTRDDTVFGSNCETIVTLKENRFLETGNCQFASQVKKMVSITTRSNYIKRIKKDEYSNALVAFLLNDKLSKVTSISNNANDISKDALFAFQTGDQSLFSSLYEEISRRKPNKESEWVFNDILLFAIVLGVCKFEANKSWIDSVLKIRLEHPQNEALLVTQTFSDILSKNLVNKNNHQPLMLVMKYLLELPLGDEVYINSIYEELALKDFPYSKTPFLNLICLKALDVIILSKGLVDLERQKAIEEFIKSFNSRITFFATTLWISLVLIILSLFIGFLVYFIKVNQQQAEIINRVLTFLSFIGFGGLVPIFAYRKKLIDFFKKPFFAYYNFKPEKIK